MNNRLIVLISFLNTRMDFRFILIDADRDSNLITSFTLRRQIGNAQLICFADPEEAIKYLLGRQYNDEFSGVYIILTDVKFTGFSTWEFIEMISDRRLFNLETGIFLFSSTADEHDLIRSQNNVLIKGILEKPLTQASIRKIIFLSEAISARSKYKFRDKNI